MSETVAGQDPAGTSSGQDPQTPGTTPAGQDPAGTGQNPTTPTSTQTQGDEHDPVRAKALIDKLRPFEKIAERLEREKADLASKLKEYDDAKLSGEERKDKRLKELERAVEQAEADKKQLRLEQALERAAVKADAKQGYSDLVVERLRKVKIEIGDDGNPMPESIQAQIAQVKADYPDLFKGAGGTPPPHIPSGGPTNAGKKRTLTRDAVEAMSHEQINEAWGTGEMQEFLKSQ